MECTIKDIKIILHKSNILTSCNISCQIKYLNRTSMNKKYTKNDIIEEEIAEWISVEFDWNGTPNDWRMKKKI